VFDMKAGIVQAFAALEALADVSGVSVLLTSDEEIGSATSRALIEDCARSSQAVLVCEPSADGGAVKIGRKGIAGYRVRLTGRAAHAGLEPWLGVNAALEMAEQMLAVAKLSVPDVETTVTPTVAAAGTTTNTVPAAAWFAVDARAWTLDELQRVDRGMRALRPHHAEAGLVVDGGGLDRPPWEPESSLPLLAEVQAAAMEIGLEPPAGVRSAGGSDGNLTAAVGVPTLDGLGAVGAHPHGRGERVDVTVMPDRVALLAALIKRLTVPA
jgi:glutamate carboxypeptidase